MSTQSLAAAVAHFRDVETFKSAPIQDFIALLHGTSDEGLDGAQRLWGAISAGSIQHVPGAGVTNFVNACYKLARLDLLREVITAGKPAWLDRPDLSTAHQWMRELSTFHSGFTYRSSLYDKVAFNPLPWASEALHLMAEYDPDHPSIGELAESHLETRALWLKVLMERRIHDELGPRSADVFPAPRRGRSKQL